MATNMNKRLSKSKKATVAREMNYIVDQRFKMKQVYPMTEAQQDFFDAYGSGKNVMAIGSAGTGKTYLAMYLALKDVLKNDKFREVIVIRSAVQTRDQGYLPGSAADKMAMFESPYIDIVNDLYNEKSAYGILKQRGSIRFMSSSFIRGLTFDNAIVIVDEAQNCNYGELSTIITRLGDDSKVVICGDTKQNDLVKSKYDVSGLGGFARVIEKMGSFETIKFTLNDVVRSSIVKEFLEAEELVGV